VCSTYRSEAGADAAGAWRESGGMRSEGVSSRGAEVLIMGTL
jgi:hypothetical protein